jgi:putative ABC transport system ATP-binding protein
MTRNLEMTVHDTLSPTSTAAGPTAPAALRAVGLSKHYGTGAAQVRALDGVTLAFGTGELTAVMGPSGSGKSTLLHLLAGLDRPTSGSVLLGERDLTTLSDRALTLVRRERIGFVFQAFNLLPTLTAAENITLPLDLAGRRADQQWYARVVDVVGLAQRLRHRPAELSGGQQQRVAVARALVARPDVIMADEPTGALDSRSAAEVLGFLRLAVDELAQSVVMVTHDPVAATYADRVLMLADGQVVGELFRPSAADVLERLAHLDRRAGPSDPVPTRGA